MHTNNMLTQEEINSIFLTLRRNSRRKIREKEQDTSTHTQTRVIVPMDPFLVFISLLQYTAVKTKVCFVKEGFSG